MTKPTSASEVAKTIVAQINANVDKIQSDTESKSTMIEIDVKIPKDRLREISGRQHIRSAFIHDLKEQLINNGFESDYTNGTLCVSEEIDSDPDIWTIKSI